LLLLLVLGDHFFNISFHLIVYLDVLLAHSKLVQLLILRKQILLKLHKCVKTCPFQIALKVIVLFKQLLNVSVFELQVTLGLYQF